MDSGRVCGLYDVVSPKWLMQCGFLPILGSKRQMLLLSCAKRWINMMNMMLKGVCVLLGALVIAGAQSVHAEETVHVPRQPYELCFADSMNEVHAPNGIESGWEIDNRAGRPRTELDSSGVLSDVMTDEHSRLIRYFNVVSEGSIDLQFQVNYVYNFNGNVLSLNDAEGNSIYRLVTSEGRFAIQQIDGSLTYVTQETCMAPYKVIFRVTADLDTGTAHTWINNVDCGTSALLGSSIRSLSFETMTRRSTKRRSSAAMCRQTMPSTKPLTTRSASLTASLRTRISWFCAIRRWNFQQGCRRRVTLPRAAEKSSSRHMSICRKTARVTFVFRTADRSCLPSKCATALSVRRMRN